MTVTSVTPQAHAGAPAVAAADWGTSSLRIWLLDAGGAVLVERRSGEGMQVARETGFAVVLDRLLAELGASAGIPVIACGMVGARQGWVEAPYVDVPSTLDEIFAGAIAVPGLDRVMRIVPGLAQRNADAPDVMRGEETQIAGAMGALGGGRHILCLPGTHSKWVEVVDGSVRGFASWMTGELFATFASQTILRHSIADNAKNVSTDSPAFAAGLKLALDRPDALTSLAFGIRAGSLLHGLSQQDAAARLSGLMLGTEIASARRRYPSDEVVLVASGGLRALYENAFRLADIAAKTVDADEAVRAGLVKAARVNGMLEMVP